MVRVLGADRNQPARFISRLFDDRQGRTAGLYWTIAFVEGGRQQFLLGPGDERFARLVSGFASCYPADANDYPFALRSNDAALLLMDLSLDHAGAPSGPRSQRFWQRVFDADDLQSSRTTDLAGGDAIDAAWIVDRLCAESASDRSAVFATLLAGHRTFAGLPVEKWSDAVIALRVRRLFPAIFMDLESAGIRDAATISAVGRHASRLDRINDMDHSPIALGQFQGALALTLERDISADRESDGGRAPVGVAGGGSVHEREIRRSDCRLDPERMVAIDPPRLAPHWSRRSR